MKMESLPILLVSISALGHAYWNYILKKAIDRSEYKLLVFWLCMVVSCIFFLPFFIFYLKKNPVSLNILIYPICFGIFQALYLFFLTKSYSHQDLSLAYPLSKTIPLFTLLLGLFVLNEHISTFAFVGIFCIIFGTYSIHLKNFSIRNLIKPVISLKNKGSIFALLTAITTAIYGLISKISLGLMNPFVFIYLGFFSTFIFYSSIFLFNRRFLGNIKSQFRRNKKAIITVGTMDILGYLLVLYALAATNLSYIFALRQISIIFTVFLGYKFLGERYVKTRFIAAFVIFIGVILIGIS